MKDKKEFRGPGLWVGLGAALGVVSILLALTLFQPFLIRKTDEQAEKIIQLESRIKQFENKVSASKGKTAVAVAPAPTPALAPANPNQTPEPLAKPAETAVAAAPQFNSSPANPPAVIPTSAPAASVPTSAPQAAQPESETAHMRAAVLPSDFTNRLLTSRRHALKPASGFTKIIAGRSECVYLGLGPDKCTWVGPEVDAYVENDLKHPLLPKIMGQDGKPAFGPMEKRGKGGHYAMGNGVATNTWMFRRVLRVARELPQVRNALGDSIKFPSRNRWDAVPDAVWQILKQSAGDPDLPTALSSLLAQDSVRRTRLAAAK